MDNTDELIRPRLVRQFTSELKPDSDLAVQTKQYQEGLDIELDVQEKKRPFTGAEIARQSLQSKCDEFFASLAQKDATEKKRLISLRPFYRNPTEHQLGREIKACGAYAVEDVNQIMKHVESKWQESNSKVATNFNKICQKLDAHKDIFKCFPNQSTYTSSLCGAVTMIVQASVNYSTIAEQLSGYVAELSDSIAVCTQWLDLFQNPQMQTRLSDIYKQFFEFFAKVATWYLKPKTSRLLDSFNTKFSDEYNSAKEEIKRAIQLISEQGQIENAWEVKMIMPRITQSFAELSASVTRNRNENNKVGKEMYTLLLEQARALQQIGRYLRTQQGEPKDPAPVENEVVTADGGETKKFLKPLRGVSRAEAEGLLMHFQALIDQVGGSDGLKLAIQAGPLFAEPATMHRLGEWTQATSGDSQILWIIGSWEPGVQTSARLAALGVIRTAVQAKAQFISYICQRPHCGKIPQFKDSEDKAGVLAMVYSFIRQLLQFRPPDDGVYLHPEALDTLTQPNGSWRTALDLLQTLLQQTPVLRYCIISGLNNLEGDARDMCQEFIEMLFAHVRNTDWPVRVLFTTSGQSRVLSPLVARESIVKTSNAFHQIKGQGLYRNIEMLE